MEHIEFTKIKHDSNGNPRYVCHFLHLNTDAEKNTQNTEGIGFVSRMYAQAVKRANKIGGRKYHTKGFGGGIVFQSYSLPELEKHIREIVAKESK